MRRQDPFFRCWILTFPLPQTSPETVSLARGCTIFMVGLSLVSQERCLAAGAAGAATKPAVASRHRQATAVAVWRLGELTSIGSAKAAGSLTGGLGAKAHPSVDRVAWGI